MLRGSTASVEFKLYRHYRNVPDTDNHRRTDRLRSAKMTRLAAWLCLPRPAVHHYYVTILTNGRQGNNQCLPSVSFSCNLSRKLQKKLLHSASECVHYIRSLSTITKDAIFSHPFYFFYIFFIIILIFIVWPFLADFAERRFTNSVCVCICIHFQWHWTKQCADVPLRNCMLTRCRLWCFLLYYTTHKAHSTCCQNNGCIACIWHYVNKIVVIYSRDCNYCRPITYACRFISIFLVITDHRGK